MATGLTSGCHVEEGKNMNDKKNVEELWLANKKIQNRNTFKLRMLTVITIILFFAIWQFVVDNGIVDSRTLPSPLKIYEAFLMKMTKKAPDGNLLSVNIIASLQISLSGFFSAVIIGVPLGLVMGWYKVLDKILTPIFEIIRPIPPVAWIPIVVVWMGVGFRAKVLIIFFSAFVPCVINSYTGIQMTNKTFINVSKTFGASNFVNFIKVGIPSSLPMVMTGIKIALGNSWSTLVAAEMLAASAGLGFMIQMGRQFARADVVVLGMVIIGVLGAILSFIFSSLEKYLLRWK